MSLRAELREALDEVVPARATPGMRERVLQTSLADKRRRRREPMTYRLRIPLALVAAVLVVAVAAAALMTWNALHSSNVSPARTAPADPLVAQLEARPLQIQFPKTKADCTSGPFNNSEGSLGTGPVYGVGGGVDYSNWGSYYNNFAYANTSIAGPILIRDRDLFKDVTNVFVGPFAAGPVVGMDVVNGKKVVQHTELVLYASQAAPVSLIGIQHKYVWHFSAGVPNGWSGSTGWQIDGLGFTEVFYTCAL
jgi:hypothetical protein